VKIRFACPSCECPASVEVAPSVPASWQCSSCEHRLTLQPPTTPGTPHVCLICGNPDLYKKKNFPHWLGLTILTVACVGFLALMGQHEPYWAWAVLLGSAAFDGLLYLAVGDVVVCYRCHAHYPGLTGSDYKPFELAMHERYRQEKIRREQLNK
jgi:hypothetical protein